MVREFHIMSIMRAVAHVALMWTVLIEVVVPTLVISKPIYHITVLNYRSQGLYVKAWYLSLVGTFVLWILVEFFDFLWGQP